jgi:hypothetical protein
MLIPSEIDNVYYSSVLSKAINVEAKGIVFINRNLKPTSGNHFSQEIHVENFETSQDVQKAIELDQDFHNELLKDLIVNGLNFLKDERGTTRNTILQPNM